METTEDKKTEQPAAGADKQPAADAAAAARIAALEAKLDALTKDMAARALAGTGKGTNMDPFGDETGQEELHVPSLLDVPPLHVACQTPGSTAKSKQPFDIEKNATDGKYYLVRCRVVAGAKIITCDDVEVLDGAVYAKVACTGEGAFSLSVVSESATPSDTDTIKYRQLYSLVLKKDANGNTTGVTVTCDYRFTPVFVLYN